MNYNILKIKENSQLKVRASEWFSEKWSIPTELYCKSMEECISTSVSVPQWYFVIYNDEIIGGIGVIENDFHERKDLKPNIAALYVEEEYRGEGIAGKMLRFVCEDMYKKGIETLYLLTKHDSFYEKYNWKFVDTVIDDNDEEMRMYYHKFS